MRLCSSATSRRRALRRSTELDEPKFRPGEIVKVLSAQGSPRGDYKVTAVLPTNEQSARKYRVRHSDEPHDRVVPEFWLRKKS
jgi:hypothetical protein